MAFLTARDALSPRLIRVDSERHPKTEAADRAARCAVLQEHQAALESATALTSAAFPNRLPAEPVPGREHPKILADMPIERVMELLSTGEEPELLVYEGDGTFVGMITHQSLDAALRAHDRLRLQAAEVVTAQLEQERQRLETNAERMVSLHKATVELLGILARAGLEQALLQASIDALTVLLQARYGAIGILDEDGNLAQFVYSGLTPEQAARIGTLPQGRGLLGWLIGSNQPLRLDKMSEHPHAVGFPPHHPPMTSLLALPIAHGNGVFGRVYLCDRSSGEKGFTQEEEMLAASFAHSIALALAHSREIAERKRAQELIHLQNVTLNQLALAEPIERVLGTVAEGLEALIGPCRCALFRFENGYLRLLSAPNIPRTLQDELERLPQRESEEITRHCAMAGERVAALLGESALLDGHQSLMQALALNSGWAFPIRGDGRGAVQGVLLIYHASRRVPLPFELEFAQTICQLIATVFRHHATEDKLYHQANFDALTGLPNRRLLLDRLDLALAQERRRGDMLALLFLDLDRFQLINDSLGHPQGDELLQQVATRLQECLRDEDTLARLGGDEFMVFLPGLKHSEDAEVVASRLVQALKRPIVLRGGVETYSSASVGISVFPLDGTDSESLHKGSDLAMYQAKRAGGNCWRRYQDIEYATTRYLHSLQNGLHRALERQEFILYYQPRLDLATGRTAGFEALLRWQQPGKGLVLPADFVPLAEETGLIVPIGTWVLETACRQAVEWQREGFGPLQMAVNVSARQFNPALVGTVQRVLQETGLDATSLELEITESVAMSDVASTIRVLDALHDIGVRTSLDDFGTGYSSLACLKRLPLHALKIDKSFVNDLETDSDDAAIVRVIVMLAENMKLRTIAEGVETATQLDFLRRHECHEVQGFLFSRPLPAIEITPLLCTGFAAPLHRVAGA